MARLDGEKVKKYKKGELAGTVATVFCAAVLIYFIVCFSLAAVNDMGILRTVVWATAPALMAVGVAVAAFCNIKYGGAMDKLLKQYVLDVFVENAQSMHPERNSLSFFIEISGSTVTITVNGYKDKIEFDFSSFKSLSAARKAGILDLISERLICTFCRLYERGGEYKSVDYREKDGMRRKSGKTIPIITDGVPDVRAMKIYLKNK